MKKTGTFFLNKDNLQLGLIMGLILPILVFIGIYFIKFSGHSFATFLKLDLPQKSVITFFGIWSLVCNIALFTYYVNTRRDKTAKGIFAITLLYGIAILVVKVVL